MFQILTPTEAHVASVTNRTEAHGDDRVPALSIGLEIEAANTLLDQIDANIRQALYKAVDGQEQLPGVEPSTPVLRCHSIDHAVLTTVHEGWTLTIDDSIDDSAPMKFGGVKVDKFKVDAKQGGSIVLKLRCGTSDIDAERAGALAMHNGSSIWITLTPPAAPADVIDGSTDAFKRDHPGADAQADLLDSSAAGDAFSASQGRQPGPDDDQGGDDGSGHPDTDGAPGAGSSDDQTGDNWPFPGTEGAATGAEGAESGTPAADSETKPARGRRPRKAAAEVE